MRFNLLGVVGLVLLAACSGGGGGVIGQGPVGGGPVGGETPEGESTTEPPAEEGKTVPKSVTAKLAGDVSITQVAVFQAVKNVIAEDGAKVAPKVPLVAARDAMVRVYVKPGESYSERPLKGVLRVLDENGEPLKAITDEKTIEGESSDSSMASTFNFRIPGGSLPLGAKFAVAITDDKATPIEDGKESSARYPLDGSDIALGLQSAGPSVRIVIVPVKYTADGSGRLPDTSQAQVDLNRETIWARYPVPEVEITVRSPFTWSYTVRGNGTGWGDLLEALINLREQDGVDDDVYYWGAFSAAPSAQSFCGNGCVAGLSTLVSDPRNAYFRASIGMGYSGPESAETMVHEIGHAHGRNHAPCSDFGSIDDVDPRFPHSSGNIGVWGFNLVTEKLVSPTSNADFMGYCDPSFVSDYTFKGLFERISTVNKGKPLPQPAGSSGSSGGAGASTPANFQFVTIGADGPEQIGTTVTIRKPPVGEPREVQLLDEKGKTLATVRGDYFAYDHLPGGKLLIRTPSIAYAGLKVSGFSRVVTR